MRSITTREAEWDEQQAAWMVALAAYEAQVHACGHYLPDTTGPDEEGRWQAELPIRCHACTAQAQARDRYTKTGANPHPEALLWPVTRRRR